MNIMVCGSRDITNYKVVFNAINKIININGNIDYTLISGGAKGVDSLVKEYATYNNFPLIEVLPQWDKYGKVAGIRRNIDMVLMSDYVICIWDNKSKGTKSVIDYCIKYNIKHEVIVYE